MPLYTLSYADYETYEPTILEGPDVGSWEDYCQGILNAAANRVLAKAGLSVWGDTVGWRHIVKEAILILKEQGFKIVRLPEVVWAGSTVIDDETEDQQHLLPKDTLARLIAHNQAKRVRQSAEMDRRREERASLAQSAEQLTLNQ